MGNVSQGNELPPPAEDRLVLVEAPPTASTGDVGPVEVEVEVEVVAFMVDVGASNSCR